MLPLFVLLSFIVMNATAMDKISITNVSLSSGNETNYGDITFSEGNYPFKITAGDNKMVFWSSNLSGIQKINVYVDDEYVSYISDRTENISDSGINGQINITANILGYNKIHIELFGKDDKVISNGSLKVSTLLKEQRLTIIYFASLSIVNMIIFMNMGANMDLLLVKDIVKKPIGPTIGMFSQYICMPMIAYCLGLVFFPDEPLFRLGLLAGGCSPGGGLSNMWTHLLGGSLDLSMVMTFASSVFALGAVPIWILTLGNAIVKTKFVIPYTNVIIGIFILVIPCFFGILVQLKCPRFTNLMKKTITPLSIVNIVFIFIFGTYANFYVFFIITWKALVAGICQAICGHVSGLLLAILFRRNWQEVIAISIETAIQNYTIGIVLLKLSLESPAGDIALAVTAIQALFMPVPLVGALTIKTLYKMCCKKKSISETGFDESDPYHRITKETNCIQDPDTEDTNCNMMALKTLPLLASNS